MSLEPDIIHGPTLTKPGQPLEVSYLGRKGDREGSWELKFIEHMLRMANRIHLHPQLHSCIDKNAKAASRLN